MRMPRVYLPEHRRMNAMRSRCTGSMFAWILNTKPVSCLLQRLDVALRAWRAAAAPARAS